MHNICYDDELYNLNSSKITWQGRFGRRLNFEFINFQTNDDAKCTCSWGNCYNKSHIGIQSSIKLFHKFHTYVTESRYRYPSDICINAFKFVCPVSENLSSKHRSLTEIDRIMKTATGRENKNTIKSVDRPTVVVGVLNHIIIYYSRDVRRAENRRKSI